MNKVRIVVDSTVDLPEKMREKVTIIPLTINFGEEEYVDGITITHKEFYEKLVETDILPTTSQATPFMFTDAFEQIVKDGDTAVVITLASTLSGTNQSAVIAAQDYPDNIFVVDSMTVAIASGILAEYGLELAEKGLSAPEIAAILAEAKEDIHIVAMLDTLEYLQKGGRISKAAAFAGGVLSIKPVVCVEKGEIIVLGKARGSKQANNLLVSEIKKAGGVDFTRPVLLGYTGLTDILLQKYIADSKALWEESPKPLVSTCIGSVVGTHAGPNAVAVAFFKKK